EDADGDLGALHALDLGGDGLGERHAAGADAGEQQLREIAVALDDLARHPPNDPRHLLGVEDRRLRRQVLSHALGWGPDRTRGIVSALRGFCQTCERVEVCERRSLCPLPRSSKSAPNPPKASRTRSGRGSNAPARRSRTSRAPGSGTNWWRSRATRSSISGSI